jgi:2-keto-4-pentenoate hydratase/2-oxohepta-3-ene-1,7-dioic acid hydratase in catechol pathway
MIGKLRFSVKKNGVMNMRLVRFKKDEYFAYGVLEENLIHEISGSIFGDFTKTGATYKLEAVKILTPCEPTKIFCVGLNYLSHIKELGLDIPKKPASFMKPLSSVINPGENIIIPEVAERVDYEGEMAVVIKDRIKDVSREEALDHILGVTAFNDVTERILSYTPQLVTYSKAFDTFTSFGSFIDTDVNPANLTVRTYLNGEKVQEGNTSELLFSAAHIISFFSQCMTLFPGDIIATGTPEHVLGMKDGDKIEIEINSEDFRLVNYVLDAKRHK